MKARMTHIMTAILLLAGISSAPAQTPSPAPALTPAHTPVVANETLAASTTFNAVGRPVARVNGVVLTDRDLLHEMYTIFPYARVHNGFPSALEADIRDGAMKMIIFEELVYQQARRVNMSVPPAQLTQALGEFHQQFNTPQQYQQFLSQECRGSDKVLQAKVERSLLIDKFLKQEVTDKAAVSAAEVKAWYDQHPENFRVPESFSFQSISFLPPANATGALLEEAGQRARNALGQAKATTSYEQFGQLAEKISEDDFRVMMGDHKNADRSKLPPIVVSTLLAMQPGQVSNIVEFDANAYTILRLNAHTPAHLESFDAVKDSLRTRLEKNKVEQLRRALATKLRQNAKIEKV